MVFTVSINSLATDFGYWIELVAKIQSAALRTTCGATDLENHRHRKRARSNCQIISNTQISASATSGYYSTPNMISKSEPNCNLFMGNFIVRAGNGSSWSGRTLRAMPLRWGTRA